MDKHKQNNITGMPVCWDERQNIAIMMVKNIDDVTCVECLRRLAKDAVLYGNQRRPRRKW
jgi:hypothetical protein